MRTAGWFRALFIVVMLFTCAVLCWYAAAQYTLRFQVADLTLSLETSRQREVKQQYEYDQVSAQLPLVQAQVEELEPQAAQAKAREAELRARRKALRAEVARLQEEQEALEAQVEALRQQAK